MLSTAALTQQPDNDDLQQYYPEEDLRNEKGGSASMNCTVTVRGTLTNCQVVSATPPEFGPATLKTARFFRVKPASRDGKPVEGSITIPLRWQTGGSARCGRDR